VNERPKKRRGPITLLQQSRKARWLVAFIAIVFLFFAYVGAYAWTVQLGFGSACHIGGGAVSFTFPDYCWGGEELKPRGFWRAVFEPAHRLDRKLRHTKWEPAPEPITELDEPIHESDTPDAP
jgi:hypothetical protein